jgi:hypothetical protein
MTATNEVMNIESNNKKYEFKPLDAESWNAFRHSVHAAVESCPVRPANLDISTINPVRIPAAGGRRNTKRSKKRNYTRKQRRQKKH